MERERVTLFSKDALDGAASRTRDLTPEARFNMPGVVWGGLVFLAIGLIALMRAIDRRQRALKRAGRFSLAFVLVSDDGTAHELRQADHDYLNTEFHPADGARPYIKSRYSQRTPVGKLGGFLRRSRVPPHVPISGVPHKT